MIAGALELQLFANLARIADDMAQAKGIVRDAVGTMEKVLGVIGAGFSATMLIDKVNSVADAMENLGNISDKTGVSVEDLSKLQFFAGTAGKDIGSVDAALGQLAKSMNSVGSAVAPSTIAFQKLGLSTKDETGATKDLNTMYGEIAVALSKYSDGANKNALARALMGKAGADQIPIMAKLVQLGPIEATTTTEQKEAAEAYGTTVAKLNQQKEILWNTVVTALLPSMEGFAEVLVRASKDTNSLDGSIKTLSDDGSIASWADKATLAISGLVDMLNAFAKVMNIIGKGLGGAAATVEATASHVSGAVAAVAALNDKSGGKTGDAYANAGAIFKAQIGTINDAMLSDIDAVMMGYDSLNAKVKAAIAARNAGKSDGYMEGGASGGAKPQAPNLGLGDPQAMAAEVKLYTSALQALEQALGKLNDQSEVEKITYQEMAGSLQKLTPAHKAELLVVAGEVDARRNTLEVLKLNGEYYAALYKSQSALYKLETDSFEADQRYLDDLQFQNSLIGKNALAQAQMNEARKIDLSLQQELKAAEQAAGENMEQYNAAAAILIQQAADQKTAVLASVTARVQAERSWATGSKAAMNDYLDNVTSAANQSKTLFTDAFKGMEDALVNFVMTGKLDFKSLANSIISDLVRIQIQSSITGPLAKAMGESGGLGGFLSGLFGGGGGSGMGSAVSDIAYLGYAAPMAAGGDFMVNKPTLFLAGEAGPERASFSGANNTGGGSAGDTYVIDARGADAAGMARLEMMIRQLNGSVEKRAILAVERAYNRNGTVSGMAMR